MKIKIFFLLALFLTLTSCYQKNAIEGNYILEDNLEQLKIGLNKGQVFKLLGAPTVSPAFGENIWVYVSEVYDRTFSFTGKKITGYQGFYIEFDANNIVSNIEVKILKDRKNIKFSSKQTQIKPKTYSSQDLENEIFKN